MRSLRIMRDLRPTRIYPAHGPMIDDAAEHLDKYVEHREVREQQVWVALCGLKHPSTALEVAQILYVHRATPRHTLHNCLSVMHRTRLGPLLPPSRR
jgi:glyoxylase-like metal-dependent hydrolase (beta-lactamase superfamily II)